jgi:hypothetical protein
VCIHVTPLSGSAASPLINKAIEFTISAKRAHHLAIINKIMNSKDKIYKEKFMAFAIRMVK